MAGIVEPSMVLLNSAPLQDHPVLGNQKFHPGNTLCTEICAPTIFVGSFEEGHFPHRFESEVDVHQTRVNTRENDGRPEWTRTIDLFRVKEAL